ncbi:Hypothetical protein HDN1F_13380 [gamma proteobacterium HdN1]|nr:Hypothetical protein HDN1F_13380 [gamma proteobacterium HdN1]
MTARTGLKFGKRDMAALGCAHYIAECTQVGVLLPELLPERWHKIGLEKGAWFRMIDVQVQRSLTLQAPPEAGRPLFLSAASGLVCLRQYFYVVADDELHLGQFAREGDLPGTLLRLFPGRLPDGPAERKAQKPDLEALTLLPAAPNWPFGALLALGSGSKAARYSGALCVLEDNGRVQGEPKIFELNRLYNALENYIGKLNIEGAFVNGDQLMLLQRGNKKSRLNALIRLPLNHTLNALLEPEVTIDVSANQIVPFELGSVKGVPLAFTDGQALPNGDFVFSAVAEDTEDSYHDGDCVGVVLGVASVHGRVLWQQPLRQVFKVEGISASVEGTNIQLQLVTDADDPSMPAMLLTTQISGYPFQS